MKNGGKTSVAFIILFSVFMNLLSNKRQHFFKKKSIIAFTFSVYTATV